MEMNEKKNYSENDFGEISVNENYTLTISHNNTINENINENENDLEEISVNINNAIGVKRNRTPQEDKWTRKNNKHKRMTGQEYVGFQRKGNVVEHNVIRKPRSLGSMYF